MINGYQLLQERCRVGRVVIYDAYDTARQQPVLIEKTQDEFPPLDVLVEVKNDYELSKNLQLPGVLSGIDLLKSTTGISVVKPWFEGVSLHQLLEKGRLPIPSILQISIAVADVLHSIHSRHIIHKDIQPANFLVHPETLELRLLTFCLASQLTSEKTGAGRSGKLKGSLPYISPEQTGRMNRSIDYRSDFYSLGVMMYRMLCGKLPFQYSKPMELVHAHIAKKPVEPHMAEPNVPKPLSDIVMKLLAKNAEDRYQSALGIKDDLQQCLRLYEQSGNLEAFVFGQKDRSSTFRISEKLYGRDGEVSLLMDAFENARSGSIEMVLVGGYSGVGKTRLINEVHKPIARENGYFTSGKYDQFNRNIPYSAIAGAFGSLIRQFLAESPDVLNYWEDTIAAAVGENGEVLTDVIPELELLLGKQPPVFKLGLNESQTRFYQVFTAFVKALATPHRPLVLFIDDLQWADSGSFDLFRHLLQDQSIQHVLIIGAYRDNEVSLSHPLMVLLDDLAKKERPVRTITLPELTQTQVNILVADSLHQQPDETQQLTELVFNKTRGNPFFINRFLQKLVDDQLIYFDGELARWQWKDAIIAGMAITDNVVDLLADKIRTLPQQAQNTLRLASCIGNRFDLHTLALIAEKEESLVASELWDAVAEELLTPVGQHTRHQNDQLWVELGVLEHNKSTGPQFAFQHDRIQQAAYTLIPEDEKKKTHLQIGRLLLQKLSPAEVQEDIFNVVSHFEATDEMVHDPEERRRIARLHFVAGERAKSANSYQPASRYYQSGLELIEPDDPEIPYYDYLLASSECEFLRGNYETSEKLFDEALAKAATNLKKAEVLASKMRLYENTSRPLDAIKIGLEGLRLLGTNLPEKPGQVRILRELMRAKYYLRGKSFADLENNPDITSPELILTMKLLVNLWGPGFLHNQNLLALAILRMVILSARFGNSPESALAYVFYGFVLSAQLKDYKNGDGFGQLGMRLNEKFNDKVLRSKVYVIYAGCVQHWSFSYADTISTLYKAHEIGIESNDLINASYATAMLSRNHYGDGEPLDSMYEKAKRFVHFSKLTQNATTLNYLYVITHFFSRMIELEPEESVLGEYVNEEKLRQMVHDFAEKEGIMLPKSWFYYFKTEWCFRMGQYEQALVHHAETIPLLSGILGFAETEVLKFFHSMSLIHANGQQGKGGIAAKWLRTVRSNQQSLKKVAALSPRNFESLYLLVEAERAGFSGRFEQAVKLYRQAKKAAQQSGAIQNLAIVNEFFAAFCLKHELEEWGQNLYQESLFQYKQWGGKAKARQLEQKMTALGIKDRTPTVFDRQTDTGGASRIDVASSSDLDLQSIFQASTTISGEVDYEKLLQKLMKIVLENAGAEKGYLLLVEDENLLVATTGNVKEDSIELINNLPLARADFLPKSIVQFVFRTDETLIINDAAKDPRFSRDAYLAEHNPKSVLCQPIIQSGECIAVIYLENNLAADAFTPARMEVLSLLSGQIAVSLENAQLYKHQHEVSDAYQRFVPQDFISALGHNNILQVKLGDSISREMTVMCCDIRSYTTIAEGMSVADNFNFINSYLMLVGPVIKKYNGFINHYLGDGFIALFKASPEDALRAAVEITSLLQEYNAIHTDGYPISLGIGLHTGQVMMGIIGDEERRDANVLSDAVNISSRLEGLTRQFGTNILLGQTTFDGIQAKQDFRFRHLGQIKLKGKGTALGVVEVITADDPGGTEAIKLHTLPDFEVALAHYFDKNFEAATALLKTVLEKNPEDMAAQFYHARALKHLNAGVPDNWDGAERISEK